MNNVAFYNFIQRLMEYRCRERPLRIDFYNGWKTFVSVIRILKPKICLFIGVEASNSFKEAMQELNLHHEGAKWDRQISRTYSRLASISIDGFSTRLIFMQHCSQMFSWSRWHEYLKETMPKELSFLNDISLNGLPLQSESIFIEAAEVEGPPQRTKDIPKYLMHKPIIACNYSDVTRDISEDAKYLSIGHAQYNCAAASVKIWRHSGERWSRQSEEVPIERLFDIALLLANTMKTVQNNEDLSQSLLAEEIIAKDDIVFLKQEIENNKTRILDSAKALRDILNDLNFDQV